jgi:hypothetical protein
VDCPAITLPVAASKDAITAMVKNAVGKSFEMVQRYKPVKPIDGVQNSMCLSLKSSRFFMQQILTR